VETRTWRLIDDGPLRGARNMALDRALLAGRAEGTSPPTLRLYAWERPTLTLGRFQDAGTVDLAEAAARGFDVAFRPTGGRAVLHDDELTYSVVASTADGVPRGVVASYRHFAVALAETFASLGIPAEVTTSTRGRASTAACYLATTQADLAVGASKLSGSAQVWEGDAVLQHGSFVISRDVAAEAAVTRLDAGDAARLAAATCTIEGYTSRRPSPGKVREATVSAFERTLGIVLEPGEWTESELRAARNLESRFRSSL
jgi:lipoate-protein ligase A